MASALQRVFSNHIHAPQLGWNYADDEVRAELQADLNPAWWFECECGYRMQGCTRETPHWCPQCQNDVDIKRR